MTEAENAPQFIAPEKGPPATRGERNRAFALLGASIVIAILGTAAVWTTITSLDVQSELLCQEEYAGFGMGTAYDRSVWWVAGAVWFSFAAVALVTFTRSRAWVASATASAIGLFLAGALSTFFYAMAYSCQG
jgi:hypothetical protein